MAFMSLLIMGAMFWFLVLGALMIIVGLILLIVGAVMYFVSKRKAKRNPRNPKYAKRTAPTVLMVVGVVFVLLPLAIASSVRLLQELSPYL
jgi:heme/copper-type cytochrome/quinol oxidase subunit 2